MNKPIDLPSAARLDDEDCNPTAGPQLSDLIEARLHRRSMLRGAVGSGAVALFGGLSLSACGGGGDSAPGLEAMQSRPGVLPGAGNAETLLGFNPVAKGVADMVRVPEGYTASVLYATGDPLFWSTPDFRNDGSDLQWHERAGDHHDGLEFFGLNASRTGRDAQAVDRGLLAMNHEALTAQYMHAAGATPNSATTRPAVEVEREIAGHGISIVEVRRRGMSWAYERGSRFNRRITPLTPVEIAGPLRGHPLMVTKYDPSGVSTRGTINNCGTGYTPWGTLLSGEENWAGYFLRPAGDDAVRSDKENVALARYGRGVTTSAAASSRHAWEKSDAGGDVAQRWNVGVQAGAPADGSGDYRNELNGQGWILEVDPYDPERMAKKRTALGRFAHENGCFSKLTRGEPLAVYLGDDSQREYVYKFVSTQAWDDADYNATDRYAVGDKYLDSGKLYVARYNDDGSGQWIELSMSNPLVRAYTAYAFTDDADVLAHARIAADAVGATKMDRPEWAATHPVTGEVYITMTNNASRKVEPANSSEVAVDAANPRAWVDPAFGGTPRTVSQGNTRNWNGHIVRMREAGGRAAATTFTWDVYLFGAESVSDPARVNLSGLTDDQDFSSPDGLWFSPNTGICWVQTDDGAYTDVTNDQMLAALPGEVGDGEAVTIDHGSRQVTTYRGAAPTDRTLKRFLVGPRGCEITGVTETADGRALFVNVQHPGEEVSKAQVEADGPFQSHWPANAGYGPGSRPRSATVVITKNNGGRIGS